MERITDREIIRLMDKRKLTEEEIEEFRKHMQSEVKEELEME
ncbi:hypothetical protein [Bacillus badius]|nr:hypothetical protein [Bacillus badius]